MIIYNYKFGRVYISYVELWGKVSVKRVLLHPNNDMM